MIGNGESLQRRSNLLMVEFKPGFGKPVCKRNPPGYSIKAGCDAATRGRRESGLVTNAPKSSNKLPSSLRTRKSGVNPKVPAVFINGLRKIKSRLDIGSIYSAVLYAELTQRREAFF